MLTKLERSSHHSTEYTMRLNKATARAAMRHYQSPGPASNQFLLDFLRLCVNTLPEDQVFIDVGTGDRLNVVGITDAPNIDEVPAS